MKKLLAVSVMMALTPLTSQAEIRINGFANVIGGITSTDDSLFGYNDRVSFSEDSLFAIQVSGDINSRMSATAQIVARGENDYKGEFEWAYITYELSDKTSISGGKLRAPLFKYSATLDVGYSYHWIQPPEPVYTVSFQTIEGLRIDHNGYAGGWDYSLQLVYGMFNGSIELGGLDSPQEIDNILNGSILVQKDWFTARVSVSRATLTIDAPVFYPLFAGLTANGFSEFAETLRLDNDSGVFGEIGVEIDKGNWFVTGEYTRRGVDSSFLPEQDAFYVSGGLRLGKYTPHITFTKHTGDPKFLEEASRLPGPLADITTRVLTGRGVDTNTYTLGLRYDVDMSIALKMDLTKQENKFNADDSDTLLRFGASYIF